MSVSGAHFGCLPLYQYSSLVLNFWVVRKNEENGNHNKLQRGAGGAWDRKPGAPFGPKWKKQSGANLPLSKGGGTFRRRRKSQKTFSILSFSLEFSGIAQKNRPPWNFFRAPPTFACNINASRVLLNFSGDEKLAKGSVFGGCLAMP